MLQYQCEVLTPQLIEEGRHLLDKNWIESGSFDPDLPLNPDFGVYLKLQQAGRFLVCTVRDCTGGCGSGTGMGPIVGYVAYTFGRSSKFKDLLVAHGEAIYVEEAYREHAPILVEYAETLLKRHGVQRIGWFVVEDSAAYTFFHRQGFERDEIVMEKRL